MRTSTSAGCCTSEGKLTHAEAAYLEGLDRCGPDATLLYNLAVLLEDLKQPQAAAQSYRAALGRRARTRPTRIQPRPPVREPRIAAGSAAALERLSEARGLAMSGEPVRVLFIGNSFTSRNDVPGLLKALAAQASRPLDVAVQSIVAGGASLRRHWNAGAAQRALGSAHGTRRAAGTVDAADQGAAAVSRQLRLFVPELIKHGARPALYLTWSRQAVPEHQALLDAAVESIARRDRCARSSRSAACGMQCGRGHADIPLYDKDGSHPSVVGSYLAACTFLLSLLGQKPRGADVAERLKIERDLASRLHAIVASVL